MPTAKRRFFRRTKPEKTSKKTNPSTPRQLAGRSGKKVGRSVQKNISNSSKPSSLSRPVATQAKKPQFPKIPRFIPERFGMPRLPFDSLRLLTPIRSGLREKVRLDRVVFSGIVMLLVGLILWQGVLLVQAGVRLNKIVLQRRELASKLQEWEDIAQKYPNYRDAYFQAAVLAYQLGEKDKEQDYLKKTLAIDPNYGPALELEKRF